MIIKRLTDDFLVEELADLRLGLGSFALYRMEKKGWTTPDALAAVRRRWRIDLRRLSYGGLKDRHAHTIQYFSIYRGPARKLTHSGVDVSYLGQSDQPFTSGQIRANRFRLVLRRLAADETIYALEQLPHVAAQGVPNYFDDQRFGSVAGGGPFLARALLLGNHEEALRLALTASYPQDRRAQKEEKRRLRQHWGDWQQCKEHLGRGHARSLVDYLVHHPQDFRGALARLRPELRGLYLSAYQSHLWNRVLAGWLEEHLPAEQLVHVRLLLGGVPMHRSLSEETLARLQALTIPLPSAKVQFAADDSVRPYFERVLREEELTLEHFRLKGFREMFFSRGERSGLCVPSNLEWQQTADDLHPGAAKLELRFDLPRGSYATLLIKRISSERME
jgi:tRNA pseudouridine13 synthase